MKVSKLFPTRLFMGLTSVATPAYADSVKVRRYVCHYRNRLYLRYEKLLMMVSGRRRLRILISVGPGEWDDKYVRNALKDGFDLYSRHDVEIGPISPERLAEFDLVVPITISESRQVRQLALLLNRKAMPIPSEESIRLCNDKYEFSQTLIKTGFGSCIPRIGMGLELPYILKKRIGGWGKECWMIHDREDERGVRVQLSDPAFYRQEIIRGSREFATHILFAKDRIVKSLNIMYEFESETPIKGKDLPLYTVIHRCPYLDLFARILRSIGFEGLCCLNYKIDRGRPYILEINPRFGGSLAPYLFSFIRHLSFD